LTSMNGSVSDLRGWRESFRSVGQCLLLLARTRLEVLAIELQEDKLRCIRLAVWIGLAVAVGETGAFMGIGLFALWLFRATGYAGVAALALSAVTGAAGQLWFVRRKSNTDPSHSLPPSPNSKRMPSVYEGVSESGLPQEAGLGRGRKASFRGGTRIRGISRAAGPEHGSSSVWVCWVDAGCGLGRRS